MSNELMTAPELARYLRVELRTVYRYLKTAQLPGMRTAGRWRFRKEDIDRWLADHGSRLQRKQQDRRILVVDDDQHFRPMLIDLLRSWGYVPQGAADGDTALAMLGEAPFDLLFVDLKMPGMDGIEFIRRAKELQPRARIIVVTAYGSKETAIDALHLGVINYLEKPIADVQAVALAVDAALRS